MSRVKNSYNYEKGFVFDYNKDDYVIGKVDCTFDKTEAICPESYRHGEVARKTRKLRHAIWNGIYDAAYDSNLAVDTYAFNIYINWTDITVEYEVDTDFDYYSFTVVIPEIQFRGIINRYKHRRRSERKTYQKAYRLFKEHFNKFLFEQKSQRLLQKQREEEELEMLLNS